MNTPLMIKLKCKQQSNGVDCTIFTLKNLEIACMLIKYKLNLTNKDYYHKQFNVIIYRKAKQIIKINEHIKDNHYTIYDNYYSYSLYHKRENKMLHIGV